MILLSAQMSPVITFFVALMLLLCRGYQRLFYFDLWAEDGQVFLTEALRDGWRSLLIPCGGNYHTVQRLFALVCAEGISPYWWPVSIFLFYVLVFSYVIAWFSSSRFSHLIDSRTVRSLTALLICFAPGLNEMLGNLANLNWILFFGFFLASVSYSEKNFDWSMIFWLVIAMTSTGSFILLAPVFLYRFIFLRNQRFDGAILLSLVTAVVILYVQSFHQLKLSPDPQTLNISRIPTITELVVRGSEVTLKLFVGSVFVRPWLGSGLATHGININGVIAWFFVFTAASFLLWWFRHEIRSERIPFVLGLVCVAAVPLLRSVGRPGALEFYLPVGHSYWALRHSFILGAVAIIFWVVLLQNRAKNRSALMFFVFLTALHGFDRFWIRAYEWGYDGYPTARIWARNSPDLEAHLKIGTPESGRIPIYPHPRSGEWSVHF